jgi:hypothetical protein
VSGQQLWIDGYNVLTSIEAALGGAVILHARDGCYRDMASVHGTYRKVQETVPAIELLGDLIRQWQVTGCRWLLDRPVSNSGRLRGVLLGVAQRAGWQWDVQLVDSPDRVLRDLQAIVATADSAILDVCHGWVNIAREVITAHVPHAWIVDLSTSRGSA